MKATMLPWIKICIIVKKINKKIITFNSKVKYQNNKKMIVKIQKNIKKIMKNFRKKCRLKNFKKLKNKFLNNKQKLFKRIAQIQIKITLMIYIQIMKKILFINNLKNKFQIIITIKQIYLKSIKNKNNYNNNNNRNKFKIHF